MVFRALLRISVARKSLLITLMLELVILSLFISTIAATAAPARQPSDKKQSNFDKICKHTSSITSSAVVDETHLMHPFVQATSHLYIDLKLLAPGAQRQDVISPVTLRFIPAAGMVAVIQLEHQKHKQQHQQPHRHDNTNAFNGAHEILRDAVCNFLIVNQVELWSRGLDVDDMVNTFYNTSLQLTAGHFINQFNEYFSNKSGQILPVPATLNATATSSVFSRTHLLDQAIQLLLVEEQETTANMSLKLGQARDFIGLHLRAALPSTSRLTNLLDELCNKAGQYLTNARTRHIGMLLLEVGTQVSEQYNSGYWVIHAVYAPHIRISNPLAAQHQHKLSMSMNPTNAALHHNYGIFLRNEISHQTVTGMSGATCVFPSLFDTQEGENVAIQTVWNVFETAVNLDPCLQVTRFALADSMAARGELARAKAHLDAAVECLSVLPHQKVEREKKENQAQRHDAIVTRLRRVHVLLPQTFESQEAMNESRKLYMDELVAITQATHALCGDSTQTRYPLLHDIGDTPNSSTCTFTSSPRDMSMSEGFGSIGFYLAFHGLSSPGYTWTVDTQARRMVANIYASLYSAELKPQKQFRPELLISQEVRPKRIKVGFISAFFHEHSVGKLTLGILHSIDRSRFEVVLIALNDGPNDDVARRIRENSDIVLDLDTTASGETRHNLARVKGEVLALDLDVLVFVEIGMHFMTYLLAFQRLARRVAMYWGHGITSGIPRDTVHAFISCKDFHTDSVMMVDDSSVVHSSYINGTIDVGESGALTTRSNIDSIRAGGKTPLYSGNTGGGSKSSRHIGSSRDSGVGKASIKNAHVDTRWVSVQDQARYMERLYLMDSLTTVFPRPPIVVATRQDARMILADMLSASPFRRYGDDSEGGVGNRVVLVSDESEHGTLRLGSPHGTPLNVYLCPQTLHKLTPSFDALLVSIVKQDPNAVLILLAEARQTRVVSVVLQRLYAALEGDTDIHTRAKAAIRVITRVRLEEFVSVAWAADVVVDPIPAGGGISTFEILSVGTPVVFLPLRTTVIQITRAIFLRMGVDMSCCMASNEKDYVVKAIRLAQNHVYANTVRQEILSSNSVLYGDNPEAIQAVRDDWTTFFLWLVTLPIN